MLANWKISHWEAMGYMIMIVFATSILYVPGTVAETAGVNAWVSLFFSLFFGLLIALLASSLGLRHPNKTVIQYSVDLMGLPLGKLVGFIFVSYYLYASCTVLRQFEELMSAAYMSLTPPLIFSLLLMLLCCMALYYGLEVIVRANSIILWFNILAIFFIFILFIWALSWPNLKPDFSMGMAQLLTGSIFPSTWFAGIAVILMLVPFIKNKTAIRSASLLAIILLFFLLEIVLIISVGTLGPKITASAIFPLFFLLNQPPEYIQVLNIQPSAIFMAVWVSGMLMKLVTFHFAGAYGLAQWLGLKCYRPLILPSGAWILLLSIISWPNVIALLDFFQYTYPFDIFVNFVLTLLLYIVSLTRKNAEN